MNDTALPRGIHGARCGGYHANRMQNEISELAAEVIDAEASAVRAMSKVVGARSLRGRYG